MDIRTHQLLDAGLCGRPTELSPGRAVVQLHTTDAMRADDSGLVHGGFVFGLADHAAMLAVNEPTVVLGSAEVRFSAPVVAGAIVVATAERIEHTGNKHVVQTEAHCAGARVFEGRFVCFVPERHVLAEGGAR